MCELTLALTAASAVMGAFGAIQQGQAASASGRYQAAVARNNQIIAERQAQDATARGRIEEQRHRVQVSQIMGQQRAAMAGQGTLLSEGSPLDILGDTAAAGELDALIIRNNAAREAYGFRAQGMNFAAESQLSRMQARNARTAGFIGAGSSLLTGASKFSDRWSKLYG